MIKAFPVTKIYKDIHEKKSFGMGARKFKISDKYVPFSEVLENRRLSSAIISAILDMGGCDPMSVNTLVNIVDQCSDIMEHEEFSKMLMDSLDHLGFTKYKTEE